MKKLVGLVVILAALTLGSYYGMGYFTERKAKESIRFINHFNGVAVKIVNYQRGWFTSKANLDWGVNVPEQTIQNSDQKQVTIPAQNYTLKMPVTIFHGPIIFSDHGVKFQLGYAHTELKIPAEYVEQFNALFTKESTSPTVGIDFGVNYFGSTRINLTVPTFKLVAKQQDGVVFEWLGMNTSTHFSPSLSQLNGTIRVNGLRFKKGPIDSNLETVNSQYDLHKTDRNLFLGEATLSAPSFVINKEGSKLFELSKLDIQTNSDIEKGLFSSHLKATIDKVLSNDKTYGPGTFDIAIHNLDADALATLNEQARQARQENTSHTGSQSDQDAARQQMLWPMLPELAKLFSKGAQFEIKEMRLALPKGNLEGHLLISLPEGKATNPLEIIQAIQGDAKLTISINVMKEFVTEFIKQNMMSPPAQKESISEIPSQTNPDNTAQAAAHSTDLSEQSSLLANNQLENLVQKGVLMKQGDDYVIQVNLSNGKLTINGKPYDSDMTKFSIKPE